jgi:uncharacterized membrane protein YkvA (DUF1232 family)
MASAARTRTPTGARAGKARSERPAEGAPRTGAKRTVMYYVKQFPAYLRLLGGLLTDKRVAMLDKLLVAGALAYIIMPIDLIPDFIPFFGEIDDLYLLIFSLQRLISNSGRSVLLSHWSGAAEDLADLNLRGAISAAAFFLPRRIRRRLRVIGRG